MDWKDYFAVAMIAVFFVVAVLTGLGIYFDSKQMHEDESAD